MLVKLHFACAQRIVLVVMGIALMNGGLTPLIKPDTVLAQDDSGIRKRLPGGRSRSIPTKPEINSSEAPQTEPQPPMLEEESSPPALPSIDLMDSGSEPIPDIPLNPPEALPESAILPEPIVSPVDKNMMDVPPVGVQENIVETPIEMPPTVQPKQSSPTKRLPGGRSRPTASQILQKEIDPNQEGLTRENLAGFQRSNFIPIRDRWRIGYTGSLLDPYAQNLLKADYPIIGQDIFFSFTGISESLFEARKLPTPQGVSRENSGSDGEFFGEGRQLFFNQNFVTSFEIFKGDTGFRPRDWAVRVTPVFNVNYLNVRERGVVNLDVRERTTRTDDQIAFQEAFFEVKLFDLSRKFDFASVRVGIQGFTSDFRGFVFADNQPGVRLFGNFLNNRYQWNIAYFNFLEKDTNSGLNSFELRHRQVWIANIYKQDFIWRGYTTQFSFHYDRDVAGNKESDQQVDQNGFPIRPARLGTLQPNNVYAYYLGWAGDGHIGRLNISHAFYQVLGDVDHDPIAGRDVAINAQLVAAELSYDIDWWRPKVSVFYGSGDRNPTDGVARGFDSILDNVNFAGNGLSYYNRQGLPLSQTGVFLTNRLSLLNDFRSSKIQGQSQFVNPGIIVANAGVDIEATPKLKVLVNFNYLWFATTEPIELVLHQRNIRQEIGQDYSLGFIYRPLLNQNIVLNGGFAYLIPNGGLKDIQGSASLYSAFLSLALTY